MRHLFYKNSINIVNLCLNWYLTYPKICSVVVFNSFTKSESALTKAIKYAKRDRHLTDYHLTDLTRLKLFSTFAYWDLLLPTDFSRDCTMVMSFSYMVADITQVNVTSQPRYHVLWMVVSRHNIINHRLVWSMPVSWQPTALQFESFTVPLPISFECVSSILSKVSTFWVSNYWVKFLYLSRFR